MVRSKRLRPIPKCPRLRRWPFWWAWLRQWHIHGHAGQSGSVLKIFPFDNWYMCDHSESFKTYQFFDSGNQTWQIQMKNLLCPIYIYTCIIDIHTHIYIYMYVYDFKYLYIKPPCVGDFLASHGRFEAQRFGQNGILWRELWGCTCPVASKTQTTRAKVRPTKVPARPATS